MIEEKKKNIKAHREIKQHLGRARDLIAQLSGQDFNHTIDFNILDVMFSKYTHQEAEMWSALQAILHSEGRKINEIKSGIQISEFAKQYTELIMTNMDPEEAKQRAVDLTLKIYPHPK